MAKAMKMARMRITTKALSEAIGLPPGAEIIRAAQDVDDQFQNTVSFAIIGAGAITPEGSEIKQMTLDEIRGSGECQP